MPFDSDCLLTADKFWAATRDAILFDVRSPREFQQGHIPGAISLPLFTDQERAEVGIVYKNSGRDDAILRGLSLVGPKMAALAQQARQQARQSKTVYLHCWRGGMRSQSVAWLLDTAGLQPQVLEGGYKSFRQLARTAFSKLWKFRVVSGCTGVGKTDVLDALKEAGQQVIDLERLANHRGSAFGSIGQQPQPTTEQFENDLFQQLDTCDPDRVVWVEDEGNRLGTVVVPPELVQSIRHAPAYFLERSAASRVDRLTEEYGQFSAERLCESVASIRKRLGPQHADRAAALIRAGESRQAIEIVLDYYDRTYLHAASLMPRETMEPVSVEGQTPQEIAMRLIDLAGSGIDLPADV